MGEWRQERGIPCCIGKSRFNPSGCQETRYRAIKRYPLKPAKIENTYLNMAKRLKASRLYSPNSHG